MHEITYLVFIRYRGPFGISIPLPKLRTAHAPRPMKALQPFDLDEIMDLSPGPSASAKDLPSHHRIARAPAV